LTDVVNGPLHILIYGMGIYLEKKECAYYSPAGYTTQDSKGDDFKEMVSQSDI